MTTRVADRSDHALSVEDDSPHVLVVDDDGRIRDLLRRYLRENGYRVTVSSSAESARSSMRGLCFDLVILDVMMPGESGTSLARWLRASSELPILMLTARAEAEHRIEGLEIGVDDYLPKPFEPRELLLRINNILRRRDIAQDRSDSIKMGDFTFHIARGELRHNDNSVKLTERERDLLRQFASRPGSPIPRHELASGASGSERAVDVQINRLRRKIERDPANPVYLQTVRGKGYILHADAPA